MTKRPILDIFWGSSDCKLNRRYHREHTKADTLFYLCVEVSGARKRVFVLNSTSWYESTVIKHSERAVLRPATAWKHSTIVRLLNTAKEFCSGGLHYEHTFAFICHFHAHFVMNTISFNPQFDSRF